MGLHRIQLSVAPFNPAGIRAYEKAGFVEKGRHREAVLQDDHTILYLDHTRSYLRVLCHSDLRHWRVLAWGASD